MPVNVMDVDGYGDLVWEGRGVFGKKDGDAEYSKIDREIEVVERVYTKKRK